MRIAVIGANGQLGADIVKDLSRHEVLSLTHEDIEIASDGCIEQLEVMKPDVIINTAAMHNVPACEIDPALAFKVNAVGSQNLAKAAKRSGAYLIHFSTDYVFDGYKNNPYVETDEPRPLNVYGVSKLAGEHLIRATFDNYCILRVAGVYGSHPCRAKNGMNFVDTMLRKAERGEELNVNAGEFTSPTYTRDISNQVVSLVETKPRGLFHCSSGRSCSWYTFAQAIFIYTEIKAKVNPTFPEPGAIRRPAYSVMDNRALNQLGFNYMPDWTVGLRRYLEEIGRFNRAA